jgi:hypothetical protein
MTTAAPSTALATIQPAFTDAERLALAGFLAGLPRPDPRHRHPAAVHHCRVLPQRAQRAAGGRRARPATRARADLPARLERAAGVRSYRRRHRAPRPGTRAPDPDHYPQGRQGRHHSARAAQRPGDRPGPSASAQKGRSSWLRTAGGWTGTALGGSSARPPAAPGSPRPSRPTRCGMRSSPPLDAGVSLRDVQEAASHADPRTTMRYDRARGSLDRHATYIVSAYGAGAAR